MQRTTVSVGPALRKVREARGVTLEEAARDTRVRLGFLEAIEAEDFHLLLLTSTGAVPADLRHYLRLSPDTGRRMYDASLGLHDEVVVVPPPGRSEPVLGAWRARDHRLGILVAATLLVLAGAFGVLSARRPAPPPANLSGATGGMVGGAELERPISVAVEAKHAVEVTIVADGGDPEPFQLRAGEGRSFDADSSITIRLSEGNTAHVIVSGVDYGFPGKDGEPWEAPTATTSPRRREADPAREGRDRRGGDRVAHRADRQHERAVDVGASRRAGHRRAAPSGGRRQRAADRRGDRARGLAGRRGDRDRRAGSDAGRRDPAGARAGSGCSAGAERRHRGGAP